MEIPLNPNVRFTERASTIKLAVEHERNPLESPIPFRSNLYYQQVVDLRPQGIDAVLHLNARKTGSHKIQIVEAGHKCSGEIADTLALIVDEHPKSQGVSRVDSCADVLDGPSVRWIAQSVRARSAQWQAQLGNIELRDDAGKRMSWSEMGKREVQTMYLGKKPNCFRVYDKKAERHRAWTLEKRRHEQMAAQMVADKVLECSDSEKNAAWQLRFPNLKAWRRDLDKRLKPSAARMFDFPPFEEWLKANCVGPMAKVLEFQKLPSVMTRVERQMGAGRVPEQLNTFEKLFSRDAVEFNPFTRLDFSQFDVKTEISIDDFSPVEFAAGLQFKQWLETGMSYQQLYAFLSRKRNAKRIVKKFAPFIAAANPAKEVSISSAELYQQYRESLTRQMAA